MPFAPSIEPAALPREVGARIGTVRTRLRAVALALASERFLLSCVAAIVCSFLLDTGLEPEVGLMRPFTYFLFVSAGVAGIGFFALAFRRSLSDDAVAVLIERHFPELEDGLVSSVQLSRDLARGGLGHTSPALIRSTIERTARRARTLDFERVVDASRILPATFLTLLALGVVGLFALQPQTRPLAEAWFQRCVLGNVNAAYPKAVALDVQVAGEDRNGETAVARGDDVTVDIVVTKGQRKVERVVVRTVPLRRSGSGGLWNPVRTRPEETRLAPLGNPAEGRYRKTYQNVTEPFQFVVDAGNHVVTNPHRVKVVDRPRIEEARFWLTYPEYTGVPPTPRAKPETTPDLRVPVGTVLDYEVVANKSLAQAALVFEYDAPAPGAAAAPAAAPPAPAPKATDKAAEPKAPAAPPQTFEEVSKDAPSIGGADKLDRRVLKGRFTVKRTMHFRFALTSSENYNEGKKPVVFSVTAVVDRPPDVKILVPGRPKQVTPRAIVPLEVEVKDDYGVASAEIRIKVEAQDQKPGNEDKIPLPGLEDGTRSQLLKHRLDLAELGLHAGDKVTYRACAFDRDIDEEKRLGESATYLLQVVAPEDLARILQDRLQRVKDDLLATAKLEHQAREDTDAMLKGVLLKTKFEDEDRRKVLLADYEQKKVTSRLVAVSQELDRLVEERELNRLGDERELDREKGIKDDAHKVADNDSPLVSQKLTDARTAAALDEATKAHLAQVPDDQERVEAAILTVASRIEKWADFADIIREVQDILGEHHRVTGGTEDALKSPGPGGGKSR